MSEERVSQLSALFDGELPREQAEMVIRRALKDPTTRKTWERYALIDRERMIETTSCVVRSSGVRPSGNVVVALM